MRAARAARSSCIRATSRRETYERRAARAPSRTYDVELADPAERKRLQRVLDALPNEQRTALPAYSPRIAQAEGCDRMNEHVGVDAELYALGVLSEGERERVDAHLATCGECSRAVGKADLVALARADVEWHESATLETRGTSPSRAGDARFSTFAKLTTAASLILFATSLQLGIRNHELVRSAHADDVALATLATSHFLQASFVPKTAGIASAKAIYARDGAWTYVIVDGDADGWHVYAKIAGERVDLATLHARGEISTGFAEPSRRFDSLELQNATGDTVARVDLVYPKASP